MTSMEIFLLSVCFLYAIALYAALHRIDRLDEKVNSMYVNLASSINKLGEKHNTLVNQQEETFNSFTNHFNKQIDEANHQIEDSHKRFLSDLEKVKEALSRIFLRR
jgi:hypothetical protein